MVQKGKKYTNYDFIAWFIGVGAFWLGIFPLGIWFIGMFMDSPFLLPNMIASIPQFLLPSKHLLYPLESTCKHIIVQTTLKSNMAIYINTLLKPRFPFFLSKTIYEEPIPRMDQGKNPKMDQTIKVQTLPFSCNFVTIQEIYIRRVGLHSSHPL